MATLAMLKKPISTENQNTNTEEFKSIEPIKKNTNEIFNNMKTNEPSNISIISNPEITGKPLEKIPELNLDSSFSSDISGYNEKFKNINKEIIKNKLLTIDSKRENINLQDVTLMDSLPEVSPIKEALNYININTEDYIPTNNTNYLIYKFEQNQLIKVKAMTADNPIIEEIKENAEKVKDIILEGTGLGIYTYIGLAFIVGSVIYYWNIEAKPSETNISININTPINTPLKNENEPLPSINLSESLKESIKESIKTNPLIAMGLASVSLVKYYKKK